MPKTAYIISAKYAPGLFKEFTLLGENLASCGVKVHYLLSQHYNAIAKEYIERGKTADLTKTHHIFSSTNSLEIIKDSISYYGNLRKKISGMYEKQKPDFVLIYNPHPLNYLLLKDAHKANSECQTAIYLHEPYKPDKQLYGILGGLYFKIVDLCQQLSLKQTDIVVLPSPYAVELFGVRFPSFKGQAHLAPILIPDRPIHAPQRRFFTIAGGMNKGKGLKEFCDLVEYVASNNLNYQFQLVTSSNIESYIESMSPSARAITRVFTSPSISDSEMFRAHAESHAFFLLHSTATQSGAMTVAFMHSTPVIARDIPAFSQFITHKKNSCLVPRLFKIEDLVEAMDTILKDQNNLSANARNTFEENFSEVNWEKNYQWLRNLLAE